MENPVFLELNMVVMFKYKNRKMEHNTDTTRNGIIYQYADFYCRNAMLKYKQGTQDTMQSVYKAHLIRFLQNLHFYVFD